MSLIAQQILLQAKSERDDVQRRISLGDDSPKLRDHLVRSTKAISKLEIEMEADRAKAAAGRKAVAAPRRHEERRSTDFKDNRAPLPDDLELCCADCSNSFTFTGKDQLFFQKKTWNAPVRCQPCRMGKKEKRSVELDGVMIECVKCSKNFFFSNDSARTFEEKNYVTPKWCGNCRTERRAEFSTVKKDAV